MSDEIAVRAPAKINWTLEVLARRDDDYHEIRTVIQTIALSDTITITPAAEISIVLSGDLGRLTDEDPEENLAYQAAVQLRRSFNTSQGALIQIEKRIPIAAGLGGGSSDAAAVLRALRTMWRLSVSDDEIAMLAAGLGSDVPFLLRGGTAVGAGRGDQLTALPDPPRRRLVLAWPHAGSADKTPRMYGALQTQHYSNGAATEHLATLLRDGREPTDADLCSAFEHILKAVDSNAGHAFADAHAIGRPHLAGAGPAFFFLLAPAQPAGPILKGLKSLGLRARETHTISAAEARERC